MRTPPNYSTLINTHACALLHKSESRQVNVKESLTLEGKHLTLFEKCISYISKQTGSWIMKYVPKLYLEFTNFAVTSLDFWPVIL